MHILVSSAYPLTSPKGNSITAKRIVRLLNNTEHTAVAINTDMPSHANAMIALHATKTLTCSKRFKALHPHGQLIIYLTGTDIYKDQPNQNPEFIEALNLADQLVVSQEASLNSVPKKHQSKCHYVPASVLLPAERDVAPPPANSFVLASHLRPVKNPFLVNRALKIILDAKVHVYTLGAALEPSMVSEAQQWQQQDPRFQWMDNVPYKEALSWMRQSAFTLNTSFSEGGSNAVAESIVLGTPVIASRIEGNVGMLGENYLGLFESGNAEDLAQLMMRCINDKDFKKELILQTLQLSKRFNPVKEKEAWCKLLT